MQGFLVSSRGSLLGRANVCFFVILFVASLALLSCRMLVPECFICFPRETFCAMFLSLGTCLIKSLLLECLLLRSSPGLTTINFLGGNSFVEKR